MQSTADITSDIHTLHIRTLTKRISDEDGVLCIRQQTQTVNVENLNLVRNPRKYGISIHAWVCSLVYVYVGV